LAKNQPLEVPDLSTIDNKTHQRLGNSELDVPINKNEEE
jgi:hypothetical protein